MSKNTTEVLCGVDIGGAHITASFINRDTCSVDATTIQRIHVDAHADANTILDTWSYFLSFFTQKGQAQIGIAMPGPFDYEKGISLIKGQAKYESLYGHNVKEGLAKRLGIDVADIIMYNDAACFLKGEVIGGSAQGYHHVAGVTLGTGLGSAVFHEGDVLNADLWCTPFKDGIAESYLSTRWIVARYEQLTGVKLPNVLALTAYLPANPFAQQVFNEFGHNLGLFLLDFAKREQVEAVILGGNIANAGVFFLEALNDVLQKGHTTLPIHISGLGEQASLLGSVYSFLLEA